MSLRLALRRTSLVFCSLVFAGLAVRAPTHSSLPLDSAGRTPGSIRDDSSWSTTGSSGSSRRPDRSWSPAPFYDEIVSLSSKTTFDAVTHALMTTQLTDAAGTGLGDALALVERVEAVRGEVPGARGDQQFRMYVRLTADALDTLERSQQFKRGADNSVYHKGYPINYREQGGTPSIQISIAPDNRRADIDVDYRASSFPVGLVQRPPDCVELRRSRRQQLRPPRQPVGRFPELVARFLRRSARSALRTTPDKAERARRIPKTPRIGKKNIDVMVQGLPARPGWSKATPWRPWATSPSDRTPASPQDSDDPSTFDRGMAPFQLMMQPEGRARRAGTRDSLEG